MTLHKTDAIILKRDRQGETSLLVDAFLASDGRTRLLAKGARNPDSVLVGKLEQFSEVELMFYRKNDDNLGVISQVNQIRGNSDLSGDIRRLSYASAVVEALESVVLPGEKQKQVFELVRQTFYMLNYCQPRKLEFYFLAFLFKSLDLLGLSPELERCVKSGQPIETDEVLFSVEKGGVMAHEQADSQTQAKAWGTPGFSLGYLKLDRGIIRSLQDIRKSSIDKLKGLNFSDKQKDVVRDMLLSFFSYHTGSKPDFNSLSFLSKLATEQEETWRGKKKAD
jgi:DNA repair protein RecO (recombination protein O)